MAVQKRNIKAANIVDRDWHAGRVTTEQVTSNYSISADYYRQKENAFKNFWSSQLVNIQNQEIEKFLDKAAKRTMEDYNYIINKWGNIYDTLPKNWSSIKKEQETKKIFISTIPNDKKIQSLLPISKELRDWANGVNKERSIYNILGHTTEDDLKVNLDAMVNSNYQGLMNIMSSGKMQGKSLVSSGKKNIRSDTLIYPSSLTIDEKNGSAVNQKTNEILYFEAQTDFSLNDVSKYNLTEEDIFQSFEEYLNGEFTGVGGLIVKTYSLKRLESTNFLKFSESKPMQDNLNDLFSTANYGRGFLTQDFVDIYTIYHLSKFIPYIISPSAIGFVSKEGFMWISNFLEKYRFYMRNKRGKAEGHFTKGKNLSTKWFKYTVPSPEIQIYNKNRGNAQFLKRINNYRYRYTDGTVTSTIF